MLKGFARKLAVTALGLVALVWLGCGESENDKAAVVKDAEQVITARDEAMKCRDLMTAGYIKRVYGDAKRCRKVEHSYPGDPVPTGADASDVRVSGDEATVKIRVHGGDELDGALGRISMRKVGDRWRLEELGVDLLRSYVHETVELSDELAQLGDPRQATCVTKTVDDLPSGTLRRFMYRLISDRSLAGDMIYELFGRCLAIAGTAGSSNDSTGRRQVHSDFLKRGRRQGMSPVALACVSRQLRSKLSEEQVEAISNGVVVPRIVNPIKRTVSRIFAGCRSEKASAGISQLREGFEYELREGLAKLPKTRVDCVVRRLRSSMSDEQLLAAMTSSSPAGLSRRVGRSVRACQSTSAGPTA